MTKRNTIQKKMLKVMLLTIGIVLLLTSAAYIIYQYYSYKEISRHQFITIGEIIAANSTPSMAFLDQGDALEVLNSLKQQKNIVAASLYDTAGKLFAYYPSTLSPDQLPQRIQSSGYRYSKEFLEGYQPVVQGNTRLGTLYLRSDLSALYSRFNLYGNITVTFFIFSFLLAYFLSQRLQKSISTPLLELADKARIISSRKDYSIRAEKNTDDETGELADAFNQMLTEIESQNQQIMALNQSLEAKVDERTRELTVANVSLKQQKDLVETIIDSSVDLIAVFNERLEYEMVNKIASEIYHRSKEEMLGSNLTDIFPALKGGELEQNIHKALKGELVHQQAYHSPVVGLWYENFYIPLKNKEGMVDRVLLVGHDISSIMTANQKLESLNRELETSNKNLEQFAYVASHDLQEPLRKIQTFAELCENSLQEPDRAKNYLEKISSSALRMSELIKSVLNYSRFDKSDAAFVPVDLNEVLDALNADLELLIKEKKATIEAAGLPAISGIPLQVHQLFLNLVSNSLKFSEKPPHIRIEASMIKGSSHPLAEVPEGDYLQIMFSDNGIGFEQQYADKAFSIFQRLHNEKKYSGTGIGLAICKRIVENHEGCISVESQPGQGTRFYILLPAKKLVSWTAAARSVGE